MTSTTSTAKAVKKLPKAIDKLPTKAAKIRALAQKGWGTGDIARALGIAFQHAYNTRNRPTKAYKPQ